MNRAALLAWPKVQTLAAQGAVALVPVGSTEAHGPHLPLSVDVVIAEEVCRRVSASLSAQGRAAVTFPPVAYSLTDFAQPFAGTVSVPAELSRALLSRVFVQLAQSGFRTVCAVNHHLEPAHFKVVHEAAKDAAAQCSARVVVADHRRAPWGPRLGEEFMHGGSHAGGYETSLVLAAAPELVDDRARHALPALEVDLPARIKAGAKDFQECGGPDAYFGDPAAASKDEGERLFAVLVECTLNALLEPT